MEEKTTTNELYQKAENYAKSSLKLVCLQTVKKSSELFAALGFGFILVVVVCFFFVLINFGVSLWVGQKLNDLALGFCLVASFYFVLAILLLVFKKTIMNKYFKNWIINQFVSHSELNAIIKQNQNNKS
ncbi:Probable transmembrane protein [Flavobacterium indicum GPTSA100-9 = DSM 17447]|jgi:hypothetical protein|uniref:Probable transmembrane protein n=1 Tax=Flavobacterium indicum (strain DSM 17447 / CIP 109464 / GPTSA100-9) TaxID=1094466 RepID=H8XQ26_FLAIG|nr:hypothetical protein [Flavobacterium indicum]CCG54242.1 Probable transmembrane protein [Flavobacterium indicum GPTSA100-9 = DSM 17447]